MFVIIAAQSLNFMRLPSANSPPHYDSADAVFYGALLAWLVQIVFVAIPLTCGLLDRMPRIVLFGVAVTAIEFLCQLLLRPHLNYRLPSLAMDCVVYWPMAYFAIRLGRRWVRMPAL